MRGSEGTCMSRFLRSCVLLLLVGLSAVRAAQAQSAAQFTFPTNGATGVDLTNLTTWTSVTGAQAYYLYVGTTSGANNLINTGEISRTDWPVCDVPTGQTLYARINTKINNTWSYTDITFTAGTSPQCKATLQQPTAGATEADLRNGFQWTTAPNATVYYLYVGTSVGAKDVVNTGETTQTSYIGY